MTTLLPTKATPITLETLDATGIQLDEIFLRLPSGAVDVVWDGSQYRAPYGTLSSPQAILVAGQHYRYVLRREGGWPSSFVLVARVVDIDGLISETEYSYARMETASTASSSAGPRRVGSDLTDADGAPSGQITDHEQQAHDNLIHYFRNKPRLRAVLGSWAEQVQELETVFWYLLTRRGLSDAEGVWLEVLGDIVGEPRRDRTDGAYRAAIRVRILVNRSNGKLPELIKIAGLMLGEGADVQVSEHYPASILVRVHSDPGEVLGVDLARALRQAKAGGVKLDLIFPTDAARTFRWGTTPTSAGLTVDAAPDTGWGSTTSAAKGGRWATVL